MHKLILLKNIKWDDPPPQMYENFNVSCFKYLLSRVNPYMGVIEKYQTGTNITIFPFDIFQHIFSC